MEGIDLSVVSVGRITMRVGWKIVRVGLGGLDKRGVGGLDNSVGNSVKVVSHRRMIFRKPNVCTAI